MKVLLINGSPHREGSTHRVLSVLEQQLKKTNVEVSWFELGTVPVHGCIDCQSCKDTHRCAFSEDQCNSLIEAMLDADGIIIGSPVYFAGANGALCALLDRAFYAAGTFGQLYKGKCAAAVVCRYRSGGSAALDRLNKYITTSQINLIGSIDYMEFHSDFSEETGRFDTKVLKKLADQMVQALSVQE